MAVKILVAGFGNKFMGDDGFGPRVVEELERTGVPEGVELRDVGLCDATLAPDLADYDLVIFVDAVKAEGAPGTLYVSEIGKDGVEAAVETESMITKISLHQTGVEEIIMTAKAIGTLPRKVVVIGCEVEKVELGEGLSENVERAIGKAVRFIFALINDKK